MTRQYVGNGESITGIPMHDMSDEEFRVYAERYAEHWDEGDRSAVIAAIEKSPLYERVPAGGKGARPAAPSSPAGSEGE